MAQRLEPFQQTRTQMIGSITDMPVSTNPIVAALVSGGGGTGAMVAPNGGSRDLSDVDMVTLLTYLQRPDVTLLGPPGAEGIKLSRRGLMRLLDAGRTVSAGTLHHLQQLNAQGRQFPSLAAAAHVVQEAHLESVKLSLELLAFFSSKECRLFADVHGGFELTMSDMSRLLDETGGGGSTIGFIQSLNDQGCKFQTLDELIQSVHIDARKARRKHDSWLIHSYLSGPSCHLLPSGVVSNLKNLPIQRLLNATGGSGQICLTILKRLEASRKSYDTIEQLVKDVKGGVINRIPVYASLRRLPLPVDPSGQTRVYIEVFIEDPTTHTFQHLGTSERQSITSPIHVEYIDFQQVFLIAQKANAQDIAIKFAVYVEQKNNPHNNNIGGHARDSSLAVSKVSSSSRTNLSLDSSLSVIGGGGVGAAGVDSAAADQLAAHRRIESKLRSDEAALDSYTAAAAGRTITQVDGSAPSFTFLTATSGLIGTTIITLNAFLAAPNQEPTTLTLMQGKVTLDMPQLVISQTIATRRENITAVDQQEIVSYLSSAQCKLLSDAGWLNISRDELTNLIYHGKGLHGTLELLKQFDMNQLRFQSFDELTTAVTLGQPNPIPIYIACRGIPNNNASTTTTSTSASASNTSIVVEVYLRDLKSSLFQFIGSTEYLSHPVGCSNLDFTHSVIVDVYSRQDHELKFQLWQVDQMRDEHASGHATAASVDRSRTALTINTNDDQHEMSPLKTLIGEATILNGTFARSPESIALPLHTGVGVEVGASLLLKHVQVQRINVSDADKKLILSYLSNPNLNHLFSSAGWVTIDMASVNFLLQAGGGGDATLELLKSIDEEGKKFLSIDALITAVARKRQVKARQMQMVQHAAAYQPTSTVGASANSPRTATVAFGGGMGGPQLNTNSPRAPSGFGFGHQYSNSPRGAPSVAAPSRALGASGSSASLLGVPSSVLGRSSSRPQLALGHSLHMSPSVQNLTYAGAGGVPHASGHTLGYSFNVDEAANYEPNSVSSRSIHQAAHVHPPSPRPPQQPRPISIGRK